MKIYTAAKYGRMGEMKRFGEIIRAAGHETTARWVDGAEETLEEKAEGALMDVADVQRADVLFFFAQPKGSLNTGGGRHFEFGYAFAQGKRCIVIGEHETIFCHLPGVVVVHTLSEALSLL